MGSRLEIVRWCDRCETEGENVDEHHVRVDDTDRVLDLCQPCFEVLLDPVIEAITELGAPAGKVSTSAPPATAPALRRRPSPGTAAEVDRRCKLCPHVCSTTSAVWQHALQVHSMKRGEYRAAAVHPDSALGQGVAA